MNRKKFPPFNVSKEDPLPKAGHPLWYERSKARDIYKELEPPKTKYTARRWKRLTRNLDELYALSGGDKYSHLGQEAEKADTF